jgi:hypothetical protein
VTTAPIPTLRSYQADAGRAIIDSVLNRRGHTITVVMARQAGKNELSAQIELYLMLRHQRLSVDAVKCAPTFEPQAVISMRRLRSLIARAEITEAAVPDTRAVRIGGTRVVFLSAEPGANVVGHTADFLLEVDEAQDVDADKFDREFRPMAAPSGATTVYYGTPWDGSTLLERAVQHNLELQRKDGVQRHFQADWIDVAAYNPAYARFVEAERQRLGENHPLFLTQYALQPVAGAGRLFTAAQRAQLQGRHARQYAPREGETYVAGLDIGGQANGGPNDATVLTIARATEAPAGAIVREPSLEVVEHIALTGVPHDELIARLADVLGRVWSVRRVVVDASGLGETIARLLQRALGEDVVQAFKFTGESKSRLGYGLLAAVNGGRLKTYAADGSPEHAAFWREIEVARVAYRSAQQMSFFVAPADGHDDYLASLALVVEAAKDALPQPRIARGRVAL